MVSVVIEGKGGIKDLVFVSRKAWLTNGKVAWEVPTGLISVLFNCGVYRRPKGWYIRASLPRRYRYTGECGERRVKPAQAGTPFVRPPVG